MSGPMLELKELRVYFRDKSSLPFGGGRYIRAVDGVSFALAEGETLGLVGESGCGKSTLGRAIVRLVEAEKGSGLWYRKADVLGFSRRELRSYRKKAQMIFQDPFGSLNPRMTLGDALEEVLSVHEKGSADERGRKVERLLEVVGLPKRYRSRYPHEFSGGQRQRVVIARALAVDPEFLVCDEPVSALDVSIQAQIINLLENLQAQLGLTYLFISHDMAVVRHISTRVAVMYLGKIVEIATTDGLFESPLHPYTRALLAAIPDVAAGRRKKRSLLEGDVPSPLNPPKGCRFHPRCPLAKERCALEEPLWSEKGGGHAVACHFA